MANNRYLVWGLIGVLALAMIVYVAVTVSGPGAPSVADVEETGSSPAPVASGLIKPHPLGDMAVGEPDAPVTIIEYASLTCSHCAYFHENTYPELKSRYIETGQARLIFREFPLDPLATVASMLARCMGGERYFAFVDVLFRRQEQWAGLNVDDPLAQLQKLAKMAGVSQGDFDACLNEQPLLDGLNAERQRARKEFGVDSTPTFFVNGERLEGALPLSAFERAMAPHIERD